jgi:hypothetical protein
MFFPSVAAVLGQAPKSRWAKFHGKRAHYYEVGGKQNKALIPVVKHKLL